MYKNVLIASALVALAATVAWADDVTIGDESSPVSLTTPYNSIHEDEDPFKGRLNLYFANDSLENYYGVQFTIFGVSGGSDPSHVLFVTSGTYYPTSSQTISSVFVDNLAVGGPTMKVWFSGDPVLPEDMGWVKIYTDNTQDKGRFGVAISPLVPEPMTMALLGAGAVALIRRRK
jgi:hypothetical protein